MRETTAWARSASRSAEAPATHLGRHDAERGTTPAASRFTTVTPVRSRSELDHAAVGPAVHPHRVPGVGGNDRDQLGRRRAEAAQAAEVAMPAP